MCDKIIYGLLTVLVLSACGSDKQTSDNKAFTFDKQNSAINNHSSEKVGIMGEWTIIKTLGSNKDSIVETSCNVCPKINFKINEIAIITYANGTIDSLNWKVTVDTMTIKKINPKTKFPYFFDHKYKMTFADKKEYTELKLSMENNYTYVLGRDN